MKIFFVFLLLFSFLNANKDFYFSFIDSNGNQISEETKQTINDGFDILENIRVLIKHDKIDDAFTLIQDLKATNKLKILNSDILILYADLVLKKNSKRLLIDVTNELENAINSSQINQSDLANAYMLLVDLKLEINKINDAKYFAQNLEQNFDDQLTKTYGKIALAKVLKQQKEYNKSISYLFDVLATTKDKNIATIVSDELFDLYVLTDQRTKAIDLIKGVLRTNMDYYLDDSYIANKKINQLLKAKMPEFASEILLELLNTTTNDEQIESYKFKLANTYMQMYDRTNYYLEKAKELYKDITSDYENGIYTNSALMYLDEINMRQGFISPNDISTKYEDSESMQQKALMQELLNDKKDKKYANILRTQAVYKNISNEIAKRFAYESLDEIFSEIDFEIIKDSINQGECTKLEDILKNSNDITFKKLIEDESLKYNFFECLLENPNDKAFYQLKDIFNLSKDANIYLFLEKMALSLNKLDDALDFSTKVEMVNNKDVLAKEFITRYELTKALENQNLLEKFFIYTKYNPDFINKSQNSPSLIDFYHDYYLHLMGKNEEKQAFDILEKLYLKQKEFKAYVYSPFVNMELARVEKENKNYQKALEYLLDALENSRRISPNDEVKIYYDILTLYDNLGQKNKKSEYLKKCKEVVNTSDSFYKKMCDEMK